MASTGLLGINPYQKGMVVDIMSKPTQMAIQLQQKEQAKNEALDRYFMDMDKNVNLAGVRSIDQNAVLQKLAENRSLFFKNKDAIRNPSKYGTEIYDKYMNNYKDALSIVNESKEAVGTLKAIETAKAQARGRGEVIDDSVMNGISNMHYGVRDPNYQKFDTANIISYKPHDPTKYQQDIYGRLKPDVDKEEEVYNKKTGKYELITTKDITNKAFDRINADVYGTYDRDLGLQKAVKTIASDQNKVNQLAQAYKDFTGNEMPFTEKDLAVAYTIALKPAAEIGTKPSMWREKAYAQDAYIRGRADLKKQGYPKMENLLDTTGSGGMPVSISNTGYEIISGKVLDKNGKPASITVSGLSGSNLPPELFSVLEKSGIDLRQRDKYKLVSKDGKIESITDPKGKVITRKTIMNAQKKYDTERKGEEPMYSYDEEEDVVTPGGVDLNKYLKK